MEWIIIRKVGINIFDGDRDSKRVQPLYLHVCLKMFTLCCGESLYSRLMLIHAQHMEFKSSINLPVPSSFHVSFPYVVCRLIDRFTNIFKCFSHLFLKRTLHFTPYTSDAILPNFVYFCYSNTSTSPA